MKSNLETNIDEKITRLEQTNQILESLLDGDHGFTVEERQEFLQDIYKNTAMITSLKQLVGSGVTTSES